MNKYMGFLSISLFFVFLSGCGSSNGFVFNPTVPIESENPAVTAAAPIARDDSFPALGNATLIQQAGAITGNDTLNGAQISEFDTQGSQGGTISIQQDGSFTYTPAFNFVGVETFTYTLSNSDGASIATITLTSTGAGRFVDNSVPDGGLGTQDDPFDTLAEAVTAAQPGDTIYVAAGDGTNGGMTGGFVLPNGVDLIGEGSGLVLSQTIEPAGQAPTIQGPIQCLGDNLISGLTIDGGTGALISLSAVGNVTVERCVLANPSGAPFLDVSDLEGSLDVLHNTFQEPDDVGADYILIDNTGGSIASTSITDNEFLNRANQDVRTLCLIILDTGGSMDVDFSRNIADGIAADQFDFGVQVDNDPELTDCTFICTNNVFNNFQNIPIFSYNATATISENFITNCADGMEVEVSSGTVNIMNNMISSMERRGIDIYYDEGAGSTVVTGNRIQNCGEIGMRATRGSNNGVPSVVFRQNIISGTVGNSLDVRWDGLADICFEIVGNSVDSDMFFLQDSPVAGTIGVQQRAQIENLNTFAPGAEFDPTDATVDCTVP